MSINLYKKTHEPVPTLNAFIRSTLLKGEVIRGTVVICLHEISVPLFLPLAVWIIF